MRKIIRNAIRCNHCGDVIESTYRHNYVQCSCGKVAVDGGTDYLRRSYSGNRDDYTDLSECVEVDERIVKVHSFALKWLQKYQDDKTPGGEQLHIGGTRICFLRSTEHGLYWHSSVWLILRSDAKGPPHRRAFSHSSVVNPSSASQRIMLWSIGPVSVPFLSTAKGPM